MKKLFISSIIALSLLSFHPTFASGDYSKELACKQKDGVYIKSLEISYPGYEAEVKNFVKTVNRLYYVVVGSLEGDAGMNELYEYDCKTKKAKSLADVTSFSESRSSEGEIDYIDSERIFIRFTSTSLYGGDDTSSPDGIAVYNRKTQKVRSMTFANQDALISEYVSDFGPINDTPFQITDVTRGKDGKLLVWITWNRYGLDMLRALSVDPKTFIAKNVTYDYTFKKVDNTPAWLKVQKGVLYEGNNANQWSKMTGVDIATFRAIGGNYGKDKNGYTNYGAKKYLPKDASAKGYHLWYSASTNMIYSYNLGDWTSVKVKNPDSIRFYSYLSFDEGNSECVDTTSSYGSYAEDGIYCYGNIAGSNTTFGIVGKVK